VTETKYGKYIITDLKTKELAPWSEKHSTKSLTPILELGDEVIKGSVNMGCAYSWPRDAAACANEKSVKPHKHDHDEVLGQFGTNPEDPYDLGGVLEVWLDNEKYLVTKSCLVYIPKGLIHGPVKFNRIDKPIFHFHIILGKDSWES
jgi:hypothetical protein